MSRDTLRAYVEYERWRAKLHREFGASGMLDDEPERVWFRPRGANVVRFDRSRPGTRTLHATRASR